MDVTNVSDLETTELKSGASNEVAWTGGFFAYGGKDAEQSATIYFAIPPGERLGKHVDTAEETQFILSGSGELIRDSGTDQIKAGDVIVLKINEAHDLKNTGTENLHVIGFFSAPTVEQHWDIERWPPDDSKVTGPPNRG